MIDAAYDPPASCFLQWVGNKRQHLAAIRAAMSMTDFDVYCEPFAGSLSVAFDLYNRGWRGPVMVGDINDDLMSTYFAVRDDPHAVIWHLKEWQKKDWQLHFHLIKDTPGGDRFYAAARFIALTNGSFMTTGHTPKPLSFDEDAIHGASKALKAFSLFRGDYRRFCPRKGWLVYADPPYLAGDTGSHSYHLSSECTQMEWHKRFSKWLHGLPCAWITTNSEAAAELYPSKVITRMKMKSSLGDRGQRIEILAADNLSRIDKRGRF